MENEKLVRYILDRFSILKNKKQEFEPVWDKCAELCYVNSNIYSDKDTKKIAQKVFDSTARNALTFFVASMKSTLVPASEKWHSLRPTDPNIAENYEVQGYIQRVTDLLFRYRSSPSSRFSIEASMLLTQLGIYGTGAFFVDEVVGKGIIYKCIPISELYIDNNDNNVVDVVYRRYELTARQAYEEFGDSVSEKIKNSLDTEPDKTFEFIHVVEPRRDRNPKAKDFKGMPYASYHLEVNAKKIVREGGYKTKPYIICRYDGIIGSPYGDSPAQQAFYDMLVANEMGKTVLRTGQLQANPPILAGNSLIDSSKLGRAGAVIRGGIDSQGRPMAVSMQYGNNLAVTLEMQQAVRQSIEKIFLMPLFQSMTKEKEMTATEVEKRELEKSMVLSPMCERIASEWLAPMIERELDILSRYGILDDVPDVLVRDGSLSIEFESPYIRLQETGKIMGIYKTSEAIMTLAQTNPSVLNVLDFEKAVRKIAEYHNIDNDILRSPEEVEELNAQQNQTAQAEQELAGLDSISKSMKNLGIQANDKAISDSAGVQEAVS